jgi:hypothetical protein
MGTISDEAALKRAYKSSYWADHFAAGSASAVILLQLTVDNGQMTIIFAFSL